MGRPLTKSVRTSSSPATVLTESMLCERLLPFSILRSFSPLPILRTWTCTLLAAAAAAAALLLPLPAAALLFWLLLLLLLLAPEEALAAAAVAAAADCAAKAAAMAAMEEADEVEGFGKVVVGPMVMPWVGRRSMVRTPRPSVQFTNKKILTILSKRMRGTSAF